jgi:amicyanin
MTNKSVWFASVAATLAIAVVLSAGSPSAMANDQASAPSVKIDNFSFGPQALTVAVGATVTWTNRDDIPHTAINTNREINSKMMNTNKKFSYTFTKAGTYAYYCTIHPKMTGTVVVQ